MRTLKLVSKKVEVTQTDISFQVGLATSTDFKLWYQLMGDDGVVVKKAIATLPIASLDLFNADPIDPVALTAALAAAGIDAAINAEQPVTAEDRLMAKRKEAKEKAAAAAEKAKQASQATT
jgi:hypothetical protein